MTHLTVSPLKGDIRKIDLADDKSLLGVLLNGIPQGKQHLDRDSDVWTPAYVRKCRFEMKGVKV